MRYNPERTHDQRCVIVPEVQEHPPDDALELLYLLRMPRSNLRSNLLHLPASASRLALEQVSFTASRLAASEQALHTTPTYANMLLALYSHSANQSISQSSNQSFCQLFNQSIRRSTHPSFYHPTGQPANQFTIQNGQLYMPLPWLKCCTEYSTVRYSMAPKS
jgi:hypothetical protein